MESEAPSEVEPIQDAPPPAPTEAHAPAQPPRQEGTPDFDPDELDTYLASLGLPRSELTLEVYRLTNYERDSRTDGGARKKYCGVVDIGPQVQEDIKSDWGGGNYLLYLKRKGKIKNLYFVSIDGEPRRPAQQNPAPAAPPAPPNPLDALQQLVPLFGIMREMRDLFTPPAGVAPAAPVAQPAEITPEAAMLKLLATDPGSVAQLRDRMFGPQEKSPIAELLEPVINAAAPALGPALVNWALTSNRQEAQQQQQQTPPVSTQAPAPKPQAQALPQGQQKAAPTNAAAPAQTQAAPAAQMEAAPPDDNEVVEMPHMDLIDGLVSMMAADLPISGGVRLVNDFCASFPTYVATIHSILAMHPDQILATLPILDPNHATAAGLEHSARWLAELKAALAAQQTQPDTTTA